MASYEAIYCRVGFGRVLAKQIHILVRYQKNQEAKIYYERWIIMSCPFCGQPGSSGIRYLCQGCELKHARDLAEHPELIPPPLTKEEYSFEVWHAIQEIKLDGVRTGKSPEEVKQKILALAREKHEQCEALRRTTQTMRPRNSVSTDELTQYNFDYTAGGNVTVPQIQPVKPNPVPHYTWFEKIMRKLDDYFFGF